MSSTFSNILDYRLHEYKHKEDDCEIIDYIIDHKEHNNITNYKEIMNEMKNKILKQVIKYENTKIIIELEFYIYNEKHKTNIENKNFGRFENNRVNNIEKKYDEIISRSSIHTNEKDFKDYLPDYMEYMRDSKVEFRKINIQLISNNRWNNWFINLLRKSLYYKIIFLNKDIANLNLEKSLYGK